MSTALSFSSDKARFSGIKKIKDKLCLNKFEKGSNVGSNVGFDIGFDEGSNVGFEWV